ncbi:MAG TPA: disulfide oxidoreductase [Thermoanaerobaculia bacterium]|nr:disulfide oxidoreductase [Thermoanaerobaculia bacterium]
MSERQFQPDMTVDEALAFHPAARWVFAAYHLGGCTNCGVSSEETLAQVAEGYGLPLRKLLGDLNSLLHS